MTTVNQIKTILGRKFRGSTIDDVQGISDYSVFEEAANNLLSKIDPMETIRRQNVSLFNGVYDYDSPSDLKGKKILDIRPRWERNSVDFRQTYTEEFDREKESTNEWFSVEYDEAEKFVRINKEVTGTIDITDLVISNWAIEASATNLIERPDLTLAGEDSIGFDIDPGDELTTIENRIVWTGTAIDLTEYEYKSSFFLPIYFDGTGTTDATAQSFHLRIGSSPADYLTLSGQFHARSGVNLSKELLLRFDWTNISTTGNPDVSNIDYVLLNFEANNTVYNTIAIGKLTAKLKHEYEYIYYSNGLFSKEPTSIEDTYTFVSKPVTDTDLLNLEGEAQNIFIYEACVVIADDLQYEAEAQKFRAHLGIDSLGQMTGQGLYGAYKNDKPSEAIRPSTKYYTPLKRR